MAAEAAQSFDVFATSARQPAGEAPKTPKAIYTIARVFSLSGGVTLKDAAALVINQSGD